MFTFHYIILCVLLLGTSLSTQGSKFFLRAPESLPSGEIASPDPRVKRALDKLGLKYSVTEDGDYKLVFEVEGDRTQNVLVKSKTQEVKGWEVRHVISICYASNSKPSADVMEAMLELNNKFNVGGIALFKGDDVYAFSFNITISAEAPAEELKAAIVIAASTADIIEKELSRSDKF